MIVLKLSQQGHAHELGRLPRQNDDGIQDIGKRVRSRTPVPAWLLRRQGEIGFDAANGANTDAGLGGGNFLGVVLTLGHTDEPVGQ